MDAQQFLAEFGHIANAPEGVARLRELVLHLAVSGRLTNRIETENADNFFSDITSKRESLESSGDIRVNRKIRNEPARGSWRIPDNWLWCRFGELSYFSAGRTPSRKESKYWNTGDYPWLSIADLDHGEIVSHSSETISEIARTEVFKSPPAPAGSLLMSFKLTIGKICLLGVDSYHNEAIIKIEPFADELISYFFKCLNGFDLSAGNKAAIKGKTLNQDSISNIEIALPPREEISRIVAKVDELMALCDQLEAQQQQRRVLQNQLRQSILQAVADSQSPHELKESWQRLDANFGQLFSAPEDVDDAIAEIKNLTARGLLAPAIQAIPDLEKIKEDCIAKRDEYIANGLMRRQKLVGMADNETVYPEHWDVCAFDEIAIVIGGVTKGRNLQGKKTVICPYLAVANVQRGYFKLENLKSIEIVATELLKYVVESGDLLITEGGDWDKVGRTAIWREDASNILHQNHVFKARIPSTLIKNEWVELIFNSGTGRDYFAGASKQTTNLSSINMTQLRSFPFPIPPLKEQENILTLFSTLENECSKWRNKLERKQNLSALFASATIATLTGIAIEQKEEPMKAPQTELMAPVRLGTPPDVKAQAPLATLLTRHNDEMSAKDLWQRFGGEIDAFYAQLKTEVANGWLLEPTPAEMHEKAER